MGLRRGLAALRKPAALDELAKRGVPQVWQQSISTLLGVIDDLDAQIAPLERELRPHARADPRVALLMTIPAVAELLGLTVASEIGDIARFPTAKKLVGCSGLTRSSSSPGRARAPDGSPRPAPPRLAGQPSRPPNSMAADQPLAPPLHHDQAPPRQGQPRRGRRRAPTGRSHGSGARTAASLR
jgi:Transposase IS116/IS110/IS902 family